jgi:hypothetical protein
MCVAMLLAFMWSGSSADAGSINASCSMETSVTGSWTLHAISGPDDGGYGGADVLINPGDYWDHDFIRPWHIPDGETAPGASVICPHGSAWAGALNPFQPSAQYQNSEGLCTHTNAGWDLLPTATYGMSIGWVDSVWYVPDADGPVTFTAELGYLIDMLDSPPPASTGAELVVSVALWEVDPGSGEALILEPKDDWLVGNVSPQFYPTDQLVRHLTVPPGGLVSQSELTEWTVDVDDAKVYSVAAGIFVESTLQYADDFAAYVPEPATLGLLAIGGLPLLSRRRAA